MNMEKELIEVRDINIKDIDDILILLKEKKFRAKQIYDWIWNKGISKFDEMKNIPKKIIDYFNESYCINKIIIVKQIESKDGTVKFLFESTDRQYFEGVLIKSKDRYTACISTQIGCKLACRFCESGRNGFTRDLSIGEMFDQVFLINEYCQNQHEKKLSNIVIMGMGEPLLNYSNTLTSINHICSDYSLSFSPSRITLSTSGVVPMIKKLADDKVKFNLAISLHSAVNKKRDLIMPINKKYNLDQLKEAIIYYHQKTGQRITYEYILLKNINDSISDANSLTEFTKISPCKINLIEYNETSESSFKKTEKEKTEKFYEFLQSKNLIVNLRISKGYDISAACGQLAKKA